MFTSRLVALFLCTSGALAGGPNLGTPITPAELAAWSINVLPDGTNLPRGSGTMIFSGRSGNVCAAPTEAISAATAATSQRFTIPPRCCDAQFTY